MIQTLTKIFSRNAFLFKVLLALILGGSFVSSALAVGIDPGTVNPNDIGLVDPSTSGFGSTSGIIGVVIGFVNNVLFLLGTVAVIIIIIEGVMLILARGNEERRKKVITTLVNLILGFILILFSYAIVNFIIVLLRGDTTSVQNQLSGVSTTYNSTVTTGGGGGFNTLSVKNVDSNFSFGTQSLSLTGSQTSTDTGSNTGVQQTTVTDCSSTYYAKNVQYSVTAPGGTPINYSANFLHVERGGAEKTMTIAFTDSNNLGTGCTVNHRFENAASGQILADSSSNSSFTVLLPAADDTSGGRIKVRDIVYVSNTATSQLTDIAVYALTLANDAIPYNYLEEHKIQATFPNGDVEEMYPGMTLYVTKPAAANSTANLTFSFNKRTSTSQEATMETIASGATVSNDTITTGNQTEIRYSQVGTYAVELQVQPQNNPGKVSIKLQVKVIPDQTRVWVQPKVGEQGTFFTINTEPLFNNNSELQSKTLSFKRRNGTSFTAVTGLDDQSMRPQDSITKRFPPNTSDYNLEEYEVTLTAVYDNNVTTAVTDTVIVMPESPIADVVLDQDSSKPSVYTLEDYSRNIDPATREVRVEPGSAGTVAHTANTDVWTVTFARTGTHNIVYTAENALGQRIEKTLPVRVSSLLDYTITFDTTAFTQSFSVEQGTGFAINVVGTNIARVRVEDSKGNTLGDLAAPTSTNGATETFSISNIKLTRPGIETLTFKIYEEGNTTPVTIAKSISVTTDGSPIANLKVYEGGVELTNPTHTCSNGQKGYIAKINTSYRFDASSSLTSEGLPVENQSGISYAWTGATGNGIEVYRTFAAISSGSDCTKVEVTVTDGGKSSTSAPIFLHFKNQKPVFDAFVIDDDPFQERVTPLFITARLEGLRDPDTGTTPNVLWAYIVNGITSSFTAGQPGENFAQIQIPHYANPGSKNQYIILARIEDANLSGFFTEVKSQEIEIETASDAAQLTVDIINPSSKDQNGNILVEKGQVEMGLSMKLGGLAITPDANTSVIWSVVPESNYVRSTSDICEPTDTGLSITEDPNVQVIADAVFPRCGFYKVSIEVNYQGQVEVFDKYVKVFETTQEFLDAKNSLSLALPESSILVASTEDVMLPPIPEESTASKGQSPPGEYFEDAKQALLTFLVQLSEVAPTEVTGPSAFLFNEANILLLAEEEANTTTSTGTVTDFGLGIDPNAQLFRKTDMTYTAEGRTTQLSGGDTITNVNPEQTPSNRAFGNQGKEYQSNKLNTRQQDILKRLLGIWDGDTSLEDQERIKNDLSTAEGGTNTLTTEQQLAILKSLRGDSTRCIGSTSGTRCGSEIGTDTNGVLCLGTKEKLTCVDKNNNEIPDVTCKADVAGTACFDANGTRLGLLDDLLVKDVDTPTSDNASKCIQGAEGTKCYDASGNEIQDITCIQEPAGEVCYDSDGNKLDTSAGSTSLGGVGGIGPIKNEDKIVTGYQIFGPTSLLECQNKVTILGDTGEEEMVCNDYGLYKNTPDSLDSFLKEKDGVRYQNTYKALIDRITGDNDPENVKKGLVSLEEAIKSSSMSELDKQEALRLLRYRYISQVDDAEEEQLATNTLKELQAKLVGSLDNAKKAADERIETIKNALLDVRRDDLPLQERSQTYVGSLRELDNANYIPEATRAKLNKKTDEDATALLNDTKNIVREADEVPQETKDQIVEALSLLEKEQQNVNETERLARTHEAIFALMTSDVFSDETKGKFAGLLSKRIEESANAHGEILDKDLAYIDEKTEQAFESINLNEQPHLMAVQVAEALKKTQGQYVENAGLTDRVKRELQNTLKTSLQQWSEDGKNRVQENSVLNSGEKDAYKKSFDSITNAGSLDAEAERLDAQAKVMGADKGLVYESSTYQQVIERLGHHTQGAYIDIRAIMNAIGNAGQRATILSGIAQIERNIYTRPAQIDTVKKLRTELHSNDATKERKTEIDAVLTNALSALVTHFDEVFVQGKPRLLLPNYLAFQKQFAAREKEANAPELQLNDLKRFYEVILGKNATLNEAKVQLASKIETFTLALAIEWKNLLKDVDSVSNAAFRSTVNTRINTLVAQDASLKEVAWELEDMKIDILASKSLSLQTKQEMIRNINGQYPYSEYFAAHKQCTHVYITDAAKKVRRVCAEEQNEIATYEKIDEDVLFTVMKEDKERVMGNIRKETNNEELITAYDNVLTELTENQSLTLEERRVLNQKLIAFTTHSDLNTEQRRNIMAELYTMPVIREELRDIEEENLMVSEESAATLGIQERVTTLRSLSSQMTESERQVIEEMTLQVLKYKVNQKNADRAVTVATRVVEKSDLKKREKEEMQVILETFGKSNVYVDYKKMMPEVALEEVSISIETVDDQELYNQLSNQYTAVLQDLDEGDQLAAVGSLTTLRETIAASNKLTDPEKKYLFKSIDRARAVLTFTHGEIKEVPEVDTTPGVTVVGDEEQPTDIKDVVEQPTEEVVDAQPTEEVNASGGLFMSVIWTLLTIFGVLIVIVLIAGIALFVSFLVYKNGHPDEHMDFEEYILNLRENVGSLFAKKSEEKPKEGTVQTGNAVGEDVPDFLQEEPEVVEEATIVSPDETVPTSDTTEQDTVSMPAPESNQAQPQDTSVDTTPSWLQMDTPETPPAPSPVEEDTGSTNINDLFATEPTEPVVPTPAPATPPASPEVHTQTMEQVQPQVEQQEMTNPAVPDFLQGDAEDQFANTSPAPSSTEVSSQATSPEMPIVEEQAQIDTTPPTPSQGNLQNNSMSVESESTSSQGGEIPPQGPAQTGQDTPPTPPTP